MTEPGELPPSIVSKFQNDAYAFELTEDGWYWICHIYPELCSCGYFATPKGAIDDMLIPQDDPVLLANERRELMLMAYGVAE